MQGFKNSTNIIQCRNDLNKTEPPWEENDQRGGEEEEEETKQNATNNADCAIRPTRGRTGVGRGREGGRVTPPKMGQDMLKLLGSFSASEGWLTQPRADMLDPPC